MLKVLLSPFRVVQYWFWTAVLKISYYIGKLDSDSPGQTNLRLSLDLNYYALMNLWKLDDYKVGWLMRMADRRYAKHLRKKIAAAKGRS